MEHARNLELAKALFNKEELSDEEIAKWNQINRMEDLTEKMLAHMNKDTTLTKTVLEYLLKNGTNWEQVIMIAVGMADYFLFNAGQTTVVTMPLMTSGSMDRFLVWKSIRSLTRRRTEHLLR